jgi:hypothetical protein
MLAPGGRIILQDNTYRFGARILRIVATRRHSLGIPFGGGFGSGQIFDWKPACKSGRAGMAQMRFICSHQIAGSEKRRIQ